MSKLISRGFTNTGKVVLKVVAAYILGILVRGKTAIGHITFRGLISSYLIFLSTSIATTHHRTPHRLISIGTLIRGVSYYSDKTGHTPIDSTWRVGDMTIIRFPLTCMTLESRWFGDLIFRLYDNKYFHIRRFFVSGKTIYMPVSFSVYVNTRNFNCFHVSVAYHHKTVWLYISGVLLSENGNMLWLYFGIYIVAYPGLRE